MLQQRFKASHPSFASKATAKGSLTVHSQQQSLITNIGFDDAISTMDYIIPEKFDGENVERLNSLAGVDTSEAKIQKFQLFVYQLSNNLIEDEEHERRYEAGNYDKIIKIYRDIDLPRLVWKDLVAKSLEQPTGRAFTQALFAAAVNTRSLDICETLLEAGADPDQIIRSSPIGGFARPIQFAMNHLVRDIDLLKLLIRFGANVDLVTEMNRDTALLKAADGYFPEAVRALVEAGADVRFETWAHDEMTPETALTRSAAYCIYVGDKGRPIELGFKVHQYLLAQYDRDADHEIIQDGLVRAAAHGRRDMIMDLLQAGADVNEVSSWGFAPLTAAAAKWDLKAHAPMAEMLLNLGANINGPYRDSGIRAIHSAAGHGDERLIRLLIDRGADISARANITTVRDRSLLGWGFQAHPTWEQKCLKINACHTAVQLALFEDFAEHTNPQFIEKRSSSALTLVRAGAAVENADLVRACRFDNLDLLLELLSRGLDINAADSSGCSALQACLEYKNLTLLGTLLKSGAAVRKNDMHAAIKWGRRDVVETLISHGAVIDATDADCSLLEAAATSKNWDLMMWLMETHDLPYDETALCAAICSGLGCSEENEKYLVALLNRRPRSTIGGTFEVTALGTAIFHRHHWVVRHLLRLNTSGACIVPLHGEGEGYYGLTRHPRHMSFQYKQKFWRRPTSIHCSVLVPALLAGDWCTARQLIQGGYRPDKLSLVVAVEAQPLEAIICMTKHMDELDIQDCSPSKLETPLQAAVRNRRVDIAEYLLSLGAEVNAPAPVKPFSHSTLAKQLFPRTALQAAVENDHVQMIELLLDAGSDVNGSPGPDYGATALQIAAGKGRVDMARRLLALGADVNASRGEQHGVTALEAAAEWGRLDMVQFLLEQGAGVSGCKAHRIQYQRAVKLAEQSGHEAVVRGLNTWRKQRVAGNEDEPGELEDSWDDQTKNGFNWGSWYRKSGKHG
jgi:ankyrin repeat protein